MKQSSSLSSTLRILGAFLCAGFLLAALLITATMAADPTPTVWLQTPAQPVDNDAEITVTIRISDVSNLYGLELRLDFDPAALEVVDLDGGTGGVQILPGACPYGDWIAANVADNTNGTVEYAVTQLNPRPPVNGDCDVAHIRFLTKQDTTTDLTFSEVILSDPDGQPITHSAVGVELAISGEKFVYLPLIVKN